MATTNDVTGDALKSRASNEKFRDNFDSIFGKKKETSPKREELLKEMKDFKESK